ncbi:hypothetical protein U1Q18_031448, partial [Sarracenia purpurea var. burkii]
QAWGPHIDLRDPHFLALSAAERQFLQSDYDDYTAANSGSLTCFRSVAIIFQVSLLQLAGFLLPCYAMVRSCYIIQSRRRRQV